MPEAPGVSLNIIITTIYTNRMAEINAGLANKLKKV